MDWFADRWEREEAKRPVGCVSAAGESDGSSGNLVRKSLPSANSSCKIFRDRYLAEVAGKQTEKDAGGATSDAKQSFDRKLADYCQVLEISCQHERALRQVQEGIVVGRLSFPSLSHVLLKYLLWG